MKKIFVFALMASIGIIAGSKGICADYSDYLFDNQNTNPEKPAAVLTPATTDTTQTQSSSSISVEQWEYKIAQPIAGQVQTSANTKYYTNWSDEEAQRIIDNIGNGLKTSNSINIPLQFILVDEQVVNAATDIDNNIYVYRGILPYVEREDELAFIIGHEMGHAVDKHVAKSIVTDNVAGVANYAGKEVLKSKVTGSLSSKLGRLGGGLGSVAGDMVVSAGDTGVNAATVATTSTMQRGRENDADLMSIDFLVKKGYNPLAGISIMSKIGDVYPDLFVDHPSTDKRVVTMYKYISQKYPSYISKGFDTEEYQKAVAKYIKH